jgi:hypothetical protein
MNSQKENVSVVMKAFDQFCWGIVFALFGLTLLTPPALILYCLLRYLGVLHA